MEKYLYPTCLYFLSNPLFNQYRLTKKVQMAYFTCCLYIVNTGYLFSEDIIASCSNKGVPG